MKIFIEKHEAVIDGWYKPKVEEANQGDIVPHTKQVGSVYLYKYECINDQDFYRKIVFSKEAILDLAEKIKQIESEVVEMPYVALPF
jgi:hypothetical protein